MKGVCSSQLKFKGPEALTISERLLCLSMLDITDEITF